MYDGTIERRKPDNQGITMKYTGQTRIDKEGDIFTILSEPYFQRSSSRGNGKMVDIQSQKEGLTMASLSWVKRQTKLE